MLVFVVRSEDYVWINSDVSHYLMYSILITNHTMPHRRVIIKTMSSVAHCVRGSRNTNNDHAMPVRGCVYTVDRRRNSWENNIGATHSTYVPHYAQSGHHVSCKRYCSIVVIQVTLFSDFACTAVITEFNTVGCKVTQKTAVNAVRVLPR